jgi:hypothetical protein
MERPPLSQYSVLQARGTDDLSGSRDENEGVACSEVRENVIKFLTSAGSEGPFAYDVDVLNVAVRWAIETNPAERSVRALSDLAYAKYIESIN